MIFENLNQSELNVPIIQSNCLVTCEALPTLSASSQANLHDEHTADLSSLTVPSTCDSPRNFPV